MCPSSKEWGGGEEQPSKEKIPAFFSFFFLRFLKMKHKTKYFPWHWELQVQTERGRCGSDPVTL